MQLFKRFILFAMIFSAMYADKQRDIMLPDLSVRLLDGKQVRLSALLEEGPLLVSFWATWCAPCKKEMIFLEEFHQKYNENSFRVLAISTDSPKSMSKVKSYIRAKKYTFLVGIDPNQEIAKKMNALLMPTTLILNKDRKVSWYHQGFIPGDEKEIEAQIRAVPVSYTHLTLPTIYSV